MKTGYVFFADGFEEIEAFTIVDVMRRAGMNVKIVSVTDSEIVKGAHSVSVFCDVNFANCDFYDADILVLPGGMPGADTLSKHIGLNKLLLSFAKNEKYVAAICAAPMALGNLGILEGYKATCYPGFEDYLKGAILEDKPVVHDRNIITGSGPGAAMAFALKIVDVIVGKDKANELHAGMCVKMSAAK